MRTLVIALALSVVALGQSSVPLPASGNVTLSLEEYNKLVELAGQPPKKTDKPPLPHVLKSAQMNLRVGGESVTGSIRLEGEVFVNGDRKVPLVSGMIVLDAQQQGAELPIEQEGGVHSALLTGPAEFAVTLETALPLVIDTGRASFQLPVPAAGAARLALTLPGDQTLVNLSPGLITNRASRDGSTLIEATLVPGQTANIWWAARLNTQAAPVVAKEVRFLSDIKTVISVDEEELAVAALAEVTVVQGEPSQFEVLVPEGYELTGATGPTLASSDVRPKSILLTVSDPAARSHQFLISMAKANTGAKAEIPLIAFQGAQRETGEVLVEGEGAMELTAAERGSLRRMDIKETSPFLRSLARATVHAAFRYQKKPGETPALALEWVRFPDSRVLSAVAQQAVVTTLVTSEGRSLTEVKLNLKNKSQPFLKVAIPAGASILSSEVAGEKVKPVQGADGTRVPLLRPGFRPSGAYEISFVFLHAGASFAKKGGAELSLPKMDVPISRVEWEVFLPQQYKVANFGGDAIAARLLPVSSDDSTGELMPPFATYLDSGTLAPGQVGGIVVDPAGAVVAGATVTVFHLATNVTQKASTDRNGRWMVANVPSGRIRITVSSSGFRTMVRETGHDANRDTSFSLALQVGSVSESVEVNEKDMPAQLNKFERLQYERTARQNAAGADTAASANVTDFQRRVAGVLPIAVTVPRTGSSYRFVRPLVVDEETRLTFNYRTR